MAFMRGGFRSNNFRVKDGAAFKDWVTAYSWNADQPEWVFINSDGTVHLYGTAEFPNARPRVFDQTSAEWKDADLAGFAIGLRGHLAEGEVFFLIAGGAEADRYTGYSELGVGHHSRYYRAAFSDDTAGEIRARMALETGIAP